MHALTASFAQAYLADNDCQKVTVTKLHEHIVEVQDW